MKKVFNFREQKLSVNEKKSLRVACRIDQIFMSSSSHITTAPSLIHANGASADRERFVTPRQIRKLNVGA
jgi:hypothetical protein